MEHNTEPKYTCQKCGKIHKERRAHDEHDECHEPVDDSIDEHEQVNIESTAKDWIPNCAYKKQKNILKRRPVSIVFNYSKIVLTDAMNRLLNRGLNFAILPIKLDLTQLLVDFKKFERSVVWKEFWHGREVEEPYVVPIFRTKKTNFPKNYSVPKGLKTFLGSIKSV